LQKPVVLEAPQVFYFRIFLTENYNSLLHLQQGHLLKNIRGHSKNV